MAGTIPLSMTQQSDQYGDPLAGGKLYFFVAGTVSTPQNAYQDLALTLPWPNPITLDAAGRIPQLFLADGLIKIRLTDFAGVVQVAADNIQVIGASSGAGGGGSVDATTVFSTGDVKPRYGTGSHTGWVRCNQKTIGSSASGATERANADCQALFQYLWATDPNLVVIGGRGATALADWNGNKQMTLPDGRGTAFVGLDDMGNTAAGRLTAAYFGADATVLGARGGLESNTLTAAQLASHAHPAYGRDKGHGHVLNGNAAGLNSGGNWGGAAPANQGLVNSTGTGIADIEIRSAPAGGGLANVTDVAGGGLPHNNVQPSMTVTFYMKL